MCGMRHLGCPGGSWLLVCELASAREVFGCITQESLKQCEQGSVTVMPGSQIGYLLERLPLALG